ncbi:hypothetical protein, conserved [Entamoeba dispar SAW760]|uniref:Rab-GAP TBC domain-containing protein n=1 Tax=Entamoeba dispar (strain ATCC PRA-260 / SAW760) TaxID=370354 RepID=B0EPH0_ENTDS|nr:uncharacterized protein EDI_198040 [Entamoeba dispar SAW760]EDR23578.1 hypothetical protein, conserved [Entamoeba dispar SAW760]|eukprot:EDR23578.1 hypothetical protein, conserved [Entamoeba dispar SAW760]
MERKEEKKGIFDFINGTNVSNAISSLFKGTTTAVSNLLIDKVDFEGDYSMCGEICQYLNKRDYLKVRQVCCFGIPRKIRGFVWYALLLRPKTTQEIRGLSNNENNLLYWNNVNEFHIDSDQFLYSEDAEVIDWDVTRTYPIGYDSLFQSDRLRNVLRRVLRMFLYIHPKGYFQGLNDIVSIIIIVLVDMFTKQKLKVEDIIQLSLEDLKRIESTTYSFLEALSSLLAVNIYGIEKDIHAIGLMNDFLNLLKVMNSKALKMDEQMLKQQTWRWFVCLFSREFTVEKVIVIWDRFISDPRGKGFRNGIVCFAAALIEDIVSHVVDIRDIEEVNKLNRNYCKEMNDITFSRILNRAIDIRVDYFQKIL